MRGPTDGISLRHDFDPCLARVEPHRLPLAVQQLQAAPRSPSLRHVPCRTTPSMKYYAGPLPSLATTTLPNVSLLVSGVTGATNNATFFGAICAPLTASTCGAPPMERR